MNSKCHKNSDFMLTIHMHVYTILLKHTYRYVAFTLLPQLDCIYHYTYYLHGNFHF